jgi:hypothetical protein
MAGVASRIFFSRSSKGPLKAVARWGTIKMTSFGLLGDMVSRDGGGRAFFKDLYSIWKQKSAQKALF